MRSSTVISTISLLATGAALLVCAGGARAQQGRPRVERQGHAGAPVETNEDLQPDTLPTMPPGMTVEMLQQGDAIFHGKGGCFACHGSEGEGRPAAGDALTVALSYVPPNWHALDSLITAGIPDALTRSPIAMPARGAKGNLTPDEVRRVAAYVWAISQTKGEPWPGGHANHVHLVPLGAETGTAPARGLKLPRP